MKTIARMSIAAAALALLAAPAHPYSYEKYLGLPVKMKYGEVTFRASGNGFPAGSNQRSALSAVSNRFNESPGAFVVRQPNWDESNVNRWNAQSETWFSNNNDILKDNAPAIAYTTTTYILPPRITEADVIYRSSVKWSFSDIKSNKTSYGGEYRNFKTTALHETGHAAGLKHVNTTYNIMGSDTTHIHANGGSVRPYVGEDAASGDVYLYGAGSTTVEDLAVTHWRYSKADGEYSEHRRTGVFEVGASNIVAWHSVNGFPTFHVTRGKTYDIQFTFENNGLHNFSGVRTRYVLSTDDNISTIDPQIGIHIFDFNRNTVDTRRATLTIPVSLKSNFVYYVGAIVDDNQKVQEYVETNNATYVQIITD